MCRVVMKLRDLVVSQRAREVTRSMYLVYPDIKVTDTVFGRLLSVEFTGILDRGVLTLESQHPVVRDKVEVWGGRLICPWCVTSCNRCRNARVWWRWARTQYLEIRSQSVEIARDWVLETSNGECVICV